MASGRIGSKRESKEISMLISSNWGSFIGAKRGSSRAALTAHRTTASPKDSLGSVTPMHPCSRPRTRRVTKTPRRSEKTPSRGMTSGILRCRTASRIALRANSSKALRSDSERHGILRLLARFEHAQLAALLDAVVHVAPKAQEILCGGDQGADDHEPKENRRQGL